MDALLPAAWYSDERILALEKQHLFLRGPRYVGHTLSVPNVGDHRPVDIGDAGLILVRSATGVEVLVNACRHRQAELVSVPGNAQHLQCPFHRWTYALDGAIIAAPHFPVLPCRNLFKVPVTVWNGLVLAGPAPVSRDLTDWGPGSIFDFTGYVFQSSVDLECLQNWKTFVEVYLDLYHVSPFHPGLAGFVTCKDLHWSTGEFFSVQRVRLKGDLTNPVTPAYATWQAKVREVFSDDLPEMGAVWAFYYPNLMLEWNPGVLIVSTLKPQSPERTTNSIEFFYTQKCLDTPGYVEAHQAAYMETAAEDERLGRMMDRGRRTLTTEGREDLGPIQTPMEDGIPHFHRYVLDHLAPMLR